MNGRSCKPAITLGAALRGIYLLTAAVALIACGGGKSSSGSSSSFTIGGTISGLNAGSVVLANDTATVTVAAGATSWVFPGSFASGSAYSVTVESQPAGVLCEVSGGSGATLPGDLTAVTVACSDFGQWIWEGGLSTVNAPGVYGTQDTASASNGPGARYAASSWTDSAGNLWLFGGVGYVSAGAAGNLNDLWRYSPSTNEWTWISGGNAVNAAGVYGAQGTPAAGDEPGARYSASSWIDAAGNLWLFGGYGYDSTGTVGKLNDLWRYSPSTNEWTWISGGNAVNGAGLYGVQGTAAAGNAPGARYSMSSWIDSTGNLWLFGGYGEDSTGTAGKLNDLWQYNPTTNQWTWIGGGNADNAVGVYGTRDIAAASNVPGARQAANSWIDSAGTLWLFGGYGEDSAGTVGYLNDLWQYSPNTNQWTWTSGGEAADAQGIYGTQGTVSASDVPGGRQAANTWIDSSGHLWLFGGYGEDSTGNVGALNDLWQYSPSTKEWASVSGGSVANASGAYGTQGIGAAGDGPGGRQAANSWIDASGNLWLFGGAGHGASGNGYLNDLWRFIRPK
jgi:N-acetylneuraminic acid mutarotase